MVRGCALDSGSLTMDTEIVRISHCLGQGERVMVRGCALDSGSVTMDTEIVRIPHCLGQGVRVMVLWTVAPSPWIRRLSASFSD